MQQLETSQDFGSGYKAPEVNYRLGSNCLVFLHRTVIPPVFRETILRELHTTHLGIVKMKGFWVIFTLVSSGLTRSNLVRIVRPKNSCAGDCLNM